MINKNDVSPNKNYLIAGGDLREMLDRLEKAKVIGTAGQIKAAPTADGTYLSFASEVKCYVTVNGDEVAVLIPMRATA